MPLPHSLDHVQCSQFHVNTAKLRNEDQGNLYTSSFRTDCNAKNVDGSWDVSISEYWGHFITYIRGAGENNCLIKRELIIWVLGWKNGEIKKVNYTEGILIYFVDSFYEVEGERKREDVCMYGKGELSLNGGRMIVWMETRGTVTEWGRKRKNECIETRGTVTS